MNNKKTYQCPNCGSGQFILSFTGVYNVTITEEDGELYGERDIHAFDGQDNDIYCAKCCKSVTKDIHW